MPEIKLKPRYRRREASAYLAEVHGVPVAFTTLEKMASVGGGPSFVYFGRIPLYPREELDRWAMAKLGKIVASTSEKSAA